MFILASCIMYKVYIKRITIFIDLITAMLEAGINISVLHNLLLLFEQNVSIYALTEFVTMEVNSLFTVRRHFISFQFARCLMPLTYAFTNVTLRVRDWGTVLGCDRHSFGSSESLSCVWQKHFNRKFYEFDLSHGISICLLMSWISLPMFIDMYFHTTYSSPWLCYCCVARSSLCFLLIPSVYSHCFIITDKTF